MGIAFIIVGGITLTTLITVFFDYLGKKNKTVSSEIEKRMDILENKQKILEETLLEKDEVINQLTKEITFVNKLLDKPNK